MASAASQLISRVIRKGNLDEVLEWGITEADMLSVEEQSHWNFLNSFYKSRATRKSVPGTNVAKKHFPTLKLTDDKHVTTAALCHQARKEAVVAALKQDLLQASEDIEADWGSAISTLASRLKHHRERGERSEDISLKRGALALREEYENAEKGVFKSVGLWPWKSLNDETHGMQEDDYVILYGRPKTGKSFHLSNVAATCHEQGLKVLLYTKEMVPLSFLRRIIACEQRLDYRLLKQGRLPPDQRQNFFDAVEAAQSGDDDSLVVLAGQDVRAGEDTIEWLHARVEQYDPDVVLVDGLYLMSSGTKKREAAWQRIQNISQEARQMQLATKKPLVATVQSNRDGDGEGADTRELAGSDSLGQDASLVLKTVRLPEGKAALLSAAAREIHLDGILTHYVPCMNFSEIRALTEAEARSCGKKGKSLGVSAGITAARGAGSGFPDNLYRFPEGGKIKASANSIERSAEEMMEILTGLQQRGVTD